MKNTFRSLEKEALTIQVPPEIADMVRSRTRGRRSLSSVGTEILARGLEIDPRKYGIEPQPVGASSN